jgi:hypothetical protein
VLEAGDGAIDLFNSAVFVNFAQLEDVRDRSWKDLVVFLIICFADLGNGGRRGLCMLYVSCYCRHSQVPARISGLHQQLP